MTNTLVKKVIRTKPGEGHWGPVYGAVAAGRDMYDPNFTDRENLGSWKWTLFQAGSIVTLAYVLNLIK